MYIFHAFTNALQYFRRHFSKRINRIYKWPALKYFFVSLLFLLFLIIILDHTQDLLAQHQEHSLIFESFSECWSADRTEWQLKALHWGHVLALRLPHPLKNFKSAELIHRTEQWRLRLLIQDHSQREETSVISTNVPKQQMFTFKWQLSRGSHGCNPARRKWKLA